MADVLLKEYVPDDLKEKPYLKDFLEKPVDKDSIGALFKKLDGAETLIGKRPGIPAADAKDEDWDKFLAPLKPAKSDEYVIPGKEGVKPDEQFLKAVRESFMAGDISKRQASKFMAAFQPQMEAYSAQRVKAQKDAQAKADADFETLAKATLGEQNKATLERVNLALRENCPPAVKPFLDKLPNESLVILASVIDAIQKKYIPADQLDPKGGSGSGGGEKSISEQGRALMASEAYMNAWHPDHDKVVKQVNALYASAKK